MRLRAVSGIMLTLLLMSMLSVAVHVVPVFTEDHPAQAIWVEPDYFDTLQKYEEFTISVMVNITDPSGAATGLYGWEYYLRWNATWLSLANTAEPDLEADFNWVNGWWVKKNVRVGNDKVWCSATGMTASDPAFTGVMWLSNYTFQVEKNVYEPEPTYVGHILMDLAGLIDDYVEDIVTPFTDKKVVEFRISSTGPYYQLTVTSSPTIGTPFTINGNPKTTPYTEWLPEDSYQLEMPQTHDGYVWSRWLEDGDTNRTKTFVLAGNTTWTGVFTIPSDVNHDGIVDVRDIVICALAFGSKPEDPNWNPDADVRQDGIIDIFDLVTIAINYGKRLPL